MHSEDNGTGPGSIILGPTVTFEWLGKPVVAKRPNGYAWNTRGMPLIGQWEPLMESGQAMRSAIDPELYVATLALLREHITAPDPGRLEYLVPGQLGGLLFQFYTACLVTETERGKSEPLSQ